MLKQIFFPPFFYVCKYKLLKLLPAEAEVGHKLQSTFIYNAIEICELGMDNNQYYRLSV